MTARAKPDVTLTLSPAEATFFAQWCKDRKVEQEVNWRSMPPEAGAILTKLRAVGYGKKKTATDRANDDYGEGLDR